MLLFTRALSAEAAKVEELRDTEFLSPDGGMDATNLVERMGRPLHFSQLARKLRRLNSNLIFEQSIRYPGKAGIYILRPSTDLEKFLGVEDKMFVCGMEAAISPEFTVPHFIEKQVPDEKNPGYFKTRRQFTGITRGWREVLLMLLKSELITLSQVEKEFQIQANPSAHWQKLTT